MIQRLGKYRIVERIGRGGMGTVYKAHDPMLDRTVALKVISADIEVTDDLRTRFFREAQACARLSHPNVITVYDMGDENGHLYIVMEFLEGDELRQLIAQRRNVLLEDKLAMMIEVCDGLDYAHKRGIVHRDIKPGNIHVLKDGHIKLLDFGIARIASAEAGLTRTGLIMGTLRYMSPEQARGRADHRSDIFSVGAVFYEFLTYQPAFPGNDPMEILERLRSEDPTPLTEVDPSMPAELGDIIARSLRKDPADRYAELAHMRIDLERVRLQLSEDADRLRVRVRARFEEIRRLQSALTERIGQSFEDETVPVVDTRITVATLSSLERIAVTKAERLRQATEQAEALRPAFEESLAAFEAGRVDEAIRGLERIVADMPDHLRAAEALHRAREAQAAAARARESLAALVRQAEAALEQGQPERSLELLRGVGDVPAGAAEVGAEVARVRGAAERELAAERARQEAARQALEQARAKGHEMGVQAAEARGRADGVQAGKYAAAVWAAAAAKQQQGTAAQEQQQYEDAARLFGEAAGEYDRAATAAFEAAAAEARRVEALTREAASLSEAGRWAEALARVDEGLALVPEHAPAMQLRARVEAAQVAAARTRQRISALLGQAEVALQQGQPARGLELLHSVGELPAGAVDLGAEVERVRGAVEQGLAAERAREDAERAREDAERAQTAARQVLERARAKAEEAAKQAVGARGRAEQAHAATYVAAMVTRAAERQRQATAAYERQEYEEAARLFAEAAHEYDSAATAARAASDAQARRVEVLATEAGALFEAGRWAEAQARLDEALALAPEHARAKGLRDRVEAARESLTALVRQAEVALEQGQPARSLELLRGVGDVSAGAAEVGAEVARVRGAAERDLAAERARQEAVRKALEQARAKGHEMGVQAAEARGRADGVQAGKYAAAAWAAAAAKQQQGTAAQEQQQYEDAARLFGEAAGEYDRASTAAFKAAAAEARRVEALTREAAGLSEAGRWAEALARVDEGLALVPEHAAAMQLRARVEAARAAAARTRQRISALLGQAEAALQQGQPARGLELLHSVGELPAGAVDLGAEVERVRGAVEQGLAAERARQEAERARADAERAQTAARQVLERARADEAAKQAKAEAAAQRKATEQAPRETEHREAVQRPADVPDRVRRRRVPPLAIGIGAAAVVVIGLSVYWQTSSTRPTPVPTPPEATAPAVKVPPASTLTSGELEAIEALRKQVTARRQAAVLAGAELRAAATFASATDKERAADAAVKQREWPVARSAYSEALSKYETASGESVALARQEEEAQRAREQMNAARRAADVGEAGRLAQGPWTKATETQRSAEAALKRGELGKAQALFVESAKAYRDADKAASDTRAADAERAQLAAVRQKLQAAEGAAAAAANARRNAEQSATSRYAPKAFALAQQKEDEGRKGLDRKEYESAESRLREAARGYQAALQEAQRAAETERQRAGETERQRAAEAERQRATEAERQKAAEAERQKAAEAERQVVAARQRQETEQTRRSTADVRAKAHADREQAVKAGADVLVKDVFASAAARESEGDRLAAAQDMVAARQAYQDAAERYGDAGRRARIVQEAKGGADQARARMAAEKERARPDTPEWSAAVAQERQATQHYQRFAYREAGESFVAATDLFAKAVARPPERPPERRPTATDEVRGVLDAYVRAFETKDISLMQKVRPGLKPEEVRRLRDSFDQSRDYRVSLKVDSLNVTGDEAIVKGRREDNLVSKGGQSFRNESSFTFRLKRTSGGWVIDAVN